MGSGAFIEVGYFPDGESHRLFHEDVNSTVQRSFGAFVVVGRRSYDVQHVKFHILQQVIDRSADVWNSMRLREAAGSLLVDIRYGYELRVIQSLDKACRSIYSSL